VILSSLGEEEKREGEKYQGPSRLGKKESNLQKASPTEERKDRWFPSLARKKRKRTLNPSS